MPATNEVLSIKGTTDILAGEEKTVTLGLQTKEGVALDPTILSIDSGCEIVKSGNDAIIRNTTAQNKTGVTFKATHQHSDEYPGDIADIDASAISAGATIADSEGNDVRGVGIISTDLLDPITTAAPATIPMVNSAEGPLAPFMTVAASIMTLGLSGQYLIEVIAKVAVNTNNEVTLNLVQDPAGAASVIKSATGQLAGTTTSSNQIHFQKVLTLTAAQVTAGLLNKLGLTAQIATADGGTIIADVKITKLS